MPSLQCCPRELAEDQFPEATSLRRLQSNSRSPQSEVTVSIFTILFIILLIGWILGWGVFHVTSALIHILLIVAVISLILHFVRGSRTAV